MSLITRKTAKARAMQYSRELRNGKFTRVSKGFLDHLERMVDAEIARVVGTHRSFGKTIEAPSIAAAVEPAHVPEPDAPVQQE